MLVVARYLVLFFVWCVLLAVWGVYVCWVIRVWFADLGLCFICLFCCVLVMFLVSLISGVACVGLLVVGIYLFRVGELIALVCVV